jgi:hypothetical protein
MAEPADVPPEIITPLRSVCLGLPETYEEPAWTGRRWCVRKRTFAHVLAIEEGSPRAHALAAGSDGPVVVLVFRSSGEELDVLAAAGHPFFRPAWGANVMGMVLDEGTDWDEVAELLTESYCVQAPKKLVALVDRPEEKPAATD